MRKNDLKEVLKKESGGKSLQKKVDLFYSVMDIKANMQKSQFQVGDKSVSDHEASEKSGGPSPGFGIPKGSQQPDGGIKSLRVDQSQSDVMLLDKKVMLEEDENGSLSANLAGNLGAFYFLLNIKIYIFTQILPF